MQTNTFQNVYISKSLAIKLYVYTICESGMIICDSGM